MSSLETISIGYWHAVATAFRLCPDICEALVNAPWSMNTAYPRLAAILASSLGLQVLHSVRSSISAPLGIYPPAKTAIPPGHSSIREEATLYNVRETSILERGEKDN